VRSFSLAFLLLLACGATTALVAQPHVPGALTDEQVTLAAPGRSWWPGMNR
jgi:hypothetical protein